MTCTRSGCNNVQCYICSKSCGYDHFNDPSRGGKAGNCPLFDEVTVRHTKEVNEAEERARRKIMEENPDIPEDALKVGVSDTNQKPGQKKNAAPVPAVQRRHQPPLAGNNQPFGQDQGAAAATNPVNPLVHPPLEQQVQGLGRGGLQPLNQAMVGAPGLPVPQAGAMNFGGANVLRLAMNFWQAQEVHQAQQPAAMNIAQQHRDPMDYQEVMAQEARRMRERRQAQQLAEQNIQLARQQQAQVARELQRQLQQARQQAQQAHQQAQQLRQLLNPNPQQLRQQAQPIMQQARQAPQQNAQQLQRAQLFAPPAAADGQSGLAQRNDRENQPQQGMGRGNAIWQPRDVAKPGTSMNNPWTLD